MRSSFAGLEMSKRTIQISQKSLDISTSNMANVLTPGYTRQRVDLNSMYIRTYKNWQTKQSKLSLGGQGVSAFGVSQVRNSYLDKRYREMSGYLAENEIKIPVYEEMQTIIDLYENVGMEEMLARFKEALSKYATNAPDNRELANIVRNSAYDITKMLNSYARDFAKLLEDNVVELETSVGYVNDLIDKIVNLNNAIVKEYKATEYGNIATGKGVSAYGPLELLDNRNMLLDELSNYADIKVEENADGSVNVWLGGVQVIAGSKYEYVVMEPYDSFGAAVIYASNGEKFNFRNGELKGYIDLVNGAGPYTNSYQNSAYGIPYYMQALDAFAAAFADLYNTTNGANDLDNPNKDARLMFGSSLDVYDAFGNLVERGAITASTIRISNSWNSDNATMIGSLFGDINTGTTSFNFADMTIGSTYYIDVTLGNTTKTVPFTPLAQVNFSTMVPGASSNFTFSYGGSDYTFSFTPVDDGSGNLDKQQTIDNLNAEIRLALGAPPGVVFFNSEGILDNPAYSTAVVNGTHVSQQSTATINIINEAIRNAFNITNPDMVFVNSEGVAVKNTVNGALTIEPSQILNLSAFRTPVAEYTISVTVGQKTMNLKVNTAGPPALTTDAQVADAINDAIWKEFAGISGAVVVDPVTGLIDAQWATISKPTNVDDSGKFPANAFADTTKRIVTTNKANLDGNHAHTLMLALDKDISFGRALDFKGTAFDYVAFLTNRLGQGIEFMNDAYDTQTVTIKNIMDSKDAVSGVSTDEEGIDMMIYQKWYNAAARMMTALDECLDRVINQMGLVGR